MKAIPALLDETGQDAVEYALMTALFAAMAAVLSQLNALVNNVVGFLRAFGL